MDPYPNPSDPVLGNRSRTIKETKQPPIKYGIRRPSFGSQVLSEKNPINGCVTIPANGGKMKKNPSFVGSAPKV